MNIYAELTDDIVDGDGIIVITAEKNQKPDETRLDLVKKNVQILRALFQKIERNCEGIFIDCF